MRKSRANKNPISRLLFNLSIILAVLSIIFYIMSMYLIHLFWCSIKDKLLESGENKIKISEQCFLTFDYVNYEVSLNSVGIKLQGLKQLDSKSEVLYKEPVYFKFNPWNLSISSFYKGGGEINQSNNKYNFIADVKYEIITNLDFVIMKKIINNPFNIIRYFKSINLIFNKVNVEADNRKILDIKDTKYTIIPRKIPDYKSFANIQNNLPPSFTIGAEIDVVKHDAKIKILPSLISPFEYHESIKARCQLDVDSSKISLAFKDIITKANIDLILHDVKLDIAELSANIKLRNEANISNSEVAISFVPRKGFTDKIITTIINNQTIKNFAVIFERADLISSFKSQIPPFTIGTKYRFKWNIGARSSGNKTNISISEMNAFTENNVGFGLKGDIRTNDLDFKMNADLLLFNAKEMVSYWTRHYMPEDNHKLDPDLAAKVKDFNSDLVFTVLKDISEFPKSTSKDIVLKILIKNNHITISNNDISSIMQKYISTKTKMVSKAILEQKNPSEFILQVAPELEILMDGLLNKNSDSKKKNIGKSLWQRLIK